MAADAGKMIMFLGVAGVGGYVIYQYTQYQKVINQLNVNDPTGQTAANFENTLPFMSFAMASFSPPTAGTPAYNAYQAAVAYLSGAVATTPSTPGTTSSGQTAATSVSTAPTTTPVTQSTATTGGSTTPSNTQPTTPQPTASDLQSAANATTASADQWNYYYRQLTGYGIEQIYGGNFDAIYGSIQANGQRATGQITAQAFLTLPAAMGLSRTAVSGMSGLGRLAAIAQFYTPVVNPMASMVYRAAHPSPYRLPVSGGMSGLGAVTQATGFEKALWAGGFIRSRRVR